MCGIAGIFNIEGGAVPVPILKKMTDILRHRGPDGDGIWTRSCIGFGHRRLAIIDLSPAGHQPMQNADGSVVLTYNGEVYNFNELRIELESKGHQFHSSSDTEVVLRAYEQWGAECVHRFNGMFAFAIWDDVNKELMLARDRYGIKPLYYFQRGSLFLFASEVKAILQHPDVQAEVETRALNEYFTFQNIFTNLTLFKGVKMLDAGSTLHLRLGDRHSQRIRPYWDYRFEETMDASEEECAEELSRLFEQAVNRQLVSDVEIGTYLSGGMDSGSITCIAARNFPNIKSFTCGFDLSSASGMELAYDERQRAESLSNLYKTEHYQVVLKAGDMERIMPELIWHLEDLRVGQCYPNYYVSRLAGKFVKVVLGGTGGDELFAGYPWRYYRALNNDDSEDYLAKYYDYWQRLIPDREKKGFFQENVYAAIDEHPTQQVFHDVMGSEAFKVESPADYVNRSLYFEIKTFLHGLLQVEDKLSMAHSLESRVPFLDNDLVDFAMKVPVKYKLRNMVEAARINENDPIHKKNQYFQKTNDGKIILRKALSNYMPDDYLGGVKQGFSAPDASWFKGESIDYIRDLLGTSRACIYEYIQPDTAHALLEEHFSGKQNRRLMIWSMLCMEWWLRKFIQAKV